MCHETTKKVNAKQLKGKVIITEDNSQPDSKEDIQEARKTWKLGKKLGICADMEEDVIQNLSKLHRSSIKRSIPRRYN